MQENNFDCGIHVIRNVHVALHSWQEAQGQLVSVYFLRAAAILRFALM